MNLTDLVLRIRALLFHARVEQELEDELEFHLAMSRRQHLAAGHKQSPFFNLACSVLIPEYFAYKSFVDNILQRTKSALGR